LGGELFLIPYDGKDVGEYIGDAGRNITGGIIDLLTNSDPVANPLRIRGCFVRTDTLGNVYAPGSAGYKSNVQFVPDYPIANEFRVASTSFNPFVTY